MINKLKWNDVYWLILAIVFYFAGAFFMKPVDVEPLKKMGLAQQEEYTYEDSEGEEYEGFALIRLKGLGKVLTYKDVYLFSIPLFILSLFFSLLIFGVEEYRHFEVQCVVLANCVLGALLFKLTTKGFVISTILFWLGIIASLVYLGTGKYTIEKIKRT